MIKELIESAFVARGNFTVSLYRDYAPLQAFDGGVFYRVEFLDYSFHTRNFDDARLLWAHIAGV